MPQSTLSLQNFSSLRQTLAKLFNFKVAGICTWDNLWKVITFDPRGQFSKFLLFRVGELHIYPSHPVKIQKSEKKIFRSETSGSCVVKKYFFEKIKKTCRGMVITVHMCHRLPKSVEANLRLIHPRTDGRTEGQDVDDFGMSLSSQTRSLAQRAQLRSLLRSKTSKRTEPKGTLSLSQGLRVTGKKPKLEKSLPKTQPQTFSWPSHNTGRERPD